MTEQQNHLVNLFTQRETLTKEMEESQQTMNTKRELFWKVQGAIEYLTQIGVELPKNEDNSELETSETEVVSPEEFTTNSITLSNP